MCFRLLTAFLSSKDCTNECDKQTLWCPFTVLLWSGACACVLRRGATVPWRKAKSEWSKLNTPIPPTWTGISLRNTVPGRCITFRTERRRIRIWEWDASLAWSLPRLFVCFRAKCRRMSIDRSGPAAKGRTPCLEDPLVPRPEGVNGCRCKVPLFHI